MKVLITGAEGSVGAALSPRLAELGHTVYTTDVETLDVTSRPQAQDAALTYRPDAIFHLAAAKHAPDGELDPGQVAELNIGGTANMVHAAQLVGAKLIVASTCKACDPETAYGASKLIAERITLNAGGVVVRFYNVRETGGNVFRLWESLPESEPIPFTACWRYFISIEQAVGLCVDALELPSGRYTVDPGPSRHMFDVADEVYPGREKVVVAKRRGDRTAEPLLAQCEWFSRAGGHLRIVNAHDPVPDAVRVADAA